MKYVPVYTLFLMSVFCTSCGGQNKPDVLKENIKSETKDSTQAGLSKAIETGTIYNSTSPHHNVVHEFTYWVAMRDYCNKALLQIHANGEVNKKLSKELERELVNAIAKLISSKFNGLKIELGLYEVFLKQINDRFLQLPLPTVH